MNREEKIKVENKGDVTFSAGGDKSPCAILKPGKSINRELLPRRIDPAKKIICLLNEKSQNEAI